jgi:outer membrane protein, multidrug efflux system
VEHVATVALNDSHRSARRRGKALRVLDSDLPGGRLRANLAPSRARYQQIVGTYVNQVLIAYGDVEDALTDLHAFSDEVGRLRDAVGASQSLRLAQVQYRQGLTDYLIVIEAERTLRANQLSLAQAVNLRMSASIHLIKALGGGWNPAEDPASVQLTSGSSTVSGTSR